MQTRYVEHFLRVGAEYIDSALYENVAKYPSITIRRYLYVLFQLLVTWLTPVQTNESSTAANMQC